MGTKTLGGGANKPTALTACTNGTVDGVTATGAVPRIVN